MPSSISAIYKSVPLIYKPYGLVIPVTTGVAVAGSAAVISILETVLEPL